MSIAGTVFSKLLFIDPGGVDWFFLPAFIYVTLVLVGGFVMRAKGFDFSTLDLSRPYILPFIGSEFLFAFLFAAKGISPFIYFQF